MRQGMARPLHPASQPPIEDAGQHSPGAAGSLTSLLPGTGAPSVPPTLMLKPPADGTATTS